MKKLFVFLFLAFVFTLNAGDVLSQRGNPTAKCFVSVNRRVTNNPLSFDTYQWTQNLHSNSSSVATRQVWAADRLIKYLNKNSLRSSIKRMNLHAGTTVASAQCPIIYDIGLSVATNNNFVDGDVGATGITGDGTSKSFNTGVNLSDLTAYSTSFFAYVPSSMAGLGATKTILGARLNDSSQRFFLRFDTTTIGGVLGGDGTVNATWGQTTAGFYCLSRTANNALRLYFNGNALSSLVTTTVTITGLDTTKIMDMADTTGATIGRWYSSTIGVDGIALGLDATQNATLYTGITAYNTDAGRP